MGKGHPIGACRWISPKLGITGVTPGWGRGRGWRELTCIFFNKSKGKTELRLPVEVLEIFHQGILLERDCVWKHNC